MILFIKSSSHILSLLNRKRSMPKKTLLRTQIISIFWFWLLYLATYSIYLHDLHTYQNKSGIYISSLVIRKCSMPRQPYPCRTKIFVLVLNLSTCAWHIPTWFWYLLQNTRPKPVEHGYVFSMAVGTIWEWLKLVPFLLGDVQLIGGGGGLALFQNKYLGRETP